MDFNGKKYELIKSTIGTCAACDFSDVPECPGSLLGISSTCLGGYLKEVVEPKLSEFIIRFDSVPEVDLRLLTFPESNNGCGKCYLRNNCFTDASTMCGVKSIFVED